MKDQSGEEVVSSLEKEDNFKSYRLRAAAAAPSLLHRLLSDVEASTSAILEFIHSSSFPSESDRHVWVSIKKSLQKLKYCSTRCIDLLKYEVENEADRQPLELWLQRAEDTAYAAEDSLIDLELMLDGGKVVATRASAETGHKGKGKVEFPVEQLVNISDTVERVCSSFDVLLIEHAGSFRFLRVADHQMVFQYNFRTPIGRVEEWKTLVALLLQNSSGIGNIALAKSPLQGSSERNVTPICIVGPRGIGKTALVHSVYSNFMVSEAFDVRLWVCMSEKTNETGLFKEMIYCITRQPCYIQEHDLLQEVLTEELMGKKFLLVLDNVENANESFWSSVLTFLEIGAKGSFILVATSSTGVASASGSKNIFYLDPLTMKSSWLIFLQYFGRPVIGFNLRKMCKQLITRCGGIPLCIKMLSGVPCCSVNEAWFEAVSHNKLWEIDELALLPALRVCYDLLPIHLKCCLKYCSLFPKNFIFEKKHIVLLWISQGFIEPTMGIEVEEVGSQYFDELLGRSFFENSPFHNPKEEYFVMHELVHLLVQLVSWEEYFRFDDCLNSASATAKHFSIAHGEFEANEISAVVKMASDIQTFYFVNRYSSQWNDTPLLSNLHSLNDLPNKFKNVRTLNLSGTDIEELPESMYLLVNLHYLGLNATKIKVFPSWMSKLVNLQTLEAKQCSHLVELPKSITEMSNLRHLDVRKEYGFVGMPSGIGRLTNLQTLSILNVGDGISQCSIEEMKNFENLRGDLQIAGLKNVGSGNIAQEVKLTSKKFLRSVTLNWNVDNGYSNFDEGVAFEVFEGLIPNDNLEELIIRNFPGIQFPTWVEDSKFSKLASVIIENCFKSSRFPSLGELPSLRYLSVRNMYGIRKLGTERSGWNILPSFPSLELLNIREMHGLEELFKVEEGDFPRLYTLSISRCLMLKNIPCFPSLLELSIHSCTRMPEISGLPSLEFLKIEGFRKTKSLNLPHSVTALKKLEINHCNELVSVEGLQCLESLKDIRVNRCPKLVIDRRQEKQLIKKHDSWTDSKGQDIGTAEVVFYKTGLAKGRWKRAYIVIAFVTRLQDILRERRISDKDVWQQKLNHSGTCKDGELLIKTKRGGLRRAGRPTLTVPTQEVTIGKFLTCKAEEMLVNKDGFRIVSHSDAAKALPIVTKPLDNDMGLADLESIKVIGKAEGGLVQLVRHKWTGQLFALKAIQQNIQEKIRKHILQELKLSLSTIQCSNVVVCYQCFHDNGVISLVLEYMDGGSLADFLKIVKKIPEPYLAAICNQILKGLIYLHHEKRIIHRDLKPSNILINHKGEVKISVFGVSDLIGSSFGQRETYKYVAPERIIGGRYGYASDMWSLGLLVLECATGQFPYPPQESFYELLEVVVDEPAPSAPADQFSPEFCSFISDCLQKNAADRKSVQVLLSHPFLSLYDDLATDLAFYFTSSGSREKGVF